MKGEPGRLESTARQGVPAGPEQAQIKSTQSPAQLGLLPRYRFRQAPGRVTRVGSDPAFRPKGVGRSAQGC
jgi:hypothetical protein